MISSIIYSCVITIAGFVMREQDFLMNLITLDGLFSAIHFLMTFINGNLTDSQIVTIVNSLYLHSILDRYIYYTMIYCLYNILCTFFWLPYNSYIAYLLSYLGLITIIPSIINKILTFEMFQSVRKKKELLIKIIISKIFTAIIKIYTKVYLDKNVEIKHSEILILLKDYRDSVNYFFDVLKNLLIMFGLSYVKNYSAPLYYNIIKYIYNYKTGDLLASYNTDTAKGYLLHIVDNRKWDDLAKPNTYKAMMHLYQNNNEKSDIFKKAFHDFNFSLIKMFTVWTIASLVNFIYLAPIISFGFLVYKYNQDYMKKLSVLSLATLVSYLYPSYLIVSAICHYGEQIIFNKLSHIMLKMFVKYLRKKSLMIFNKNRNLMISYFTIICHVILLQYLAIQNSYVFIGLNMVANILMSIEIKKQMIFIVVMISTCISDYNIFHVLFNSLIMYILTGTMRDPEYQDVILILTLINDYYTKIKNKIKKDEAKRMTRDSIDETVSFEDEIFNKPEEDFIDSIGISDKYDINIINDYTVRDDFFK
jgi:hypothetical protein